MATLKNDQGGGSGEMPPTSDYSPQGESLPPGAPLADQILSRFIDTLATDLDPDTAAVTRRLGRTLLQKKPTEADLRIALFDVEAL
ncbi:hypothetical protein [Achromobacter kerstersii]